MLSTLLTAALSLSTLSSAASIRNTRRQDAGVVRLQVTAEKLTDLVSIKERQIVSPVANVQTGTRYMVSFSIGSPPQQVSLALDTGSSETWVNPQCSTSGSATSVALCNSFPVYNPGTSSTAKDLNSANTLYYGKGEADIEYYEDSFLIGSDTVTGQIFGVAQSSADIPTGLMGVGPGVELTGYPIIIDSLATQGFTQSRAFSLDLRGFESPEGAIIFGGIDTGKYSGNLEKCPIIPASEAPDGFPRYWIHMSSLGITKPGAEPKLYSLGSGDPKGQPVFLDSGGTLSRLPTPLFNAILADFPGATEEAGSGIYAVDCSVAEQDGSIDFGFGGTVIKVPYKEFIWHISGFCYLGVAADDGIPVLGDSFLRAAFVVYDQDNQNLHLANAANCGTNLVAITSGPDAVPSLKGDCGGAAPTSSSSVIPSASATPSESASASSSAVETSAPASSTAVETSSPSETAPTSTSAVETSAAETTASETSSAYETSAAETSEPVTTYIPTFKPTITSTATPYTLSTVYATSVYTITSCAPTVTDCPGKIGHVTTEIISLYTTLCPVAEATPTATAIPTGYTLSTVYETTVYTVSSCAPTVYNCPYGSLTTETVSAYTTLCPVTAEASPTDLLSYTTQTAYFTSTGTVTVHKPVETYAASSLRETAPVSVSTYAPLSTVLPVVVVTYPVATSTALGVAKPSGTGVAPVEFTGAASLNRVSNYAALGVAALGLLVVV